MMFGNLRLRAVLGAATALAVVAGVGVAVATTSSAAGARYVTLVASSGNVTQTYATTGTVTRKNTSVVSFGVDGTVKKVDVAVGDQVDAGDVLAVLDKGRLQLAVLDAETAVARAKASLYAAQHPASTSSAGSSGHSGGSGDAGAGVTIDPAVLNEAASRVNLAVLDEADTCNAIFGAILPPAEPTPTASATAGGPASATPSASPTPSATSTPTTSAQPTPASGSTQSSGSAAGEPAATASASQLAKTLDDGDVTDAQLRACANARAEVILANSNLQAVVARLTSPRPAGGTSGSAKSSGSSSSASSVSAAAVASARADLLKAEQQLASANDDLSDAELVAPISGTVGVVGLAEGASASAGSITIVGSGSAVVSFELPLPTRQLLSVGQSVTVTPAGSTKPLIGKITAIAPLETSGTSGTASTYTTTVSVADAAGLLASGAKASVLIPVKSASGVVRLPASAVTPTGTGTATVQVVDAAGATTATTVAVTTGVVGGGWVQITSGLDAGRIVVLADNTAAIPSNQSNRRVSGATSSASSSAPAAGSASSAAPAPAPASGSTAAASARPSATASR